ncbi:HNH endonuclease [Aestuariivirga sp.]|uniref:HNH endonuclease n=1 Tax=Aestuariivirga sp. TaxID=2650926 RepID=UPI003BAC4720
MKGVFQTKVTPGYDDLPESRYHFPRMYLNQVQKTVGDWIVYYEPRRSTADVLSRGGRLSYFAVARVTNVQVDPLRSDHFYAYVDSYLPFDRAVPFREGPMFYETAMKGLDGRTNAGSAQRAVRNMPDEEFNLILRAGFAAELPIVTPGAEVGSGFSEPPVSQARPIVELTVMRPFRDAIFARQIQEAYDKRCAMTGLRIINGGGRAEAQAAHIRPVAKDGPDSPRNGVALSSTVHWMFDRGLLSIDDDFKILKAKGAVPDEVARLLHPSGHLLVPEDFRLRPHPQFLKFHRENIFKG